MLLKTLYRYIPSSSRIYWKIILEDKYLKEKKRKKSKISNCIKEY